MFDKLSTIESQYEDLMARLGTAEVQSDPVEYRKSAKALSDIEPLVQKYREYRQVEKDIAGARELTQGGDPELRDLAQEELPELERKRDVMLGELRILLIPKDPNDDRNVLLEIRAGTGGDEAALFAADLFRMYRRFVERRGWKLEILSFSEATGGGIKEVVAQVHGEGAYGVLKHESGVHRVQRVPATEQQGRIHTSAATVAVLPEAEEVDVEIRSEDIKVDVFRSSGPGGQSVNTTDSAVRVTYLPTGLVVSCQDEKSQLKNKTKALRVLRSRLLDQRIAEREAERARDRKTMVGTGDRSAKIRTYNFPQSRLTDHRINLTLHRLSDILDGDLNEVTDALRVAARREELG
jgi:peptide chain release factor 1